MIPHTREQQVRKKRLEKEGSGGGRAGERKSGEGDAGRDG